MTEVQTVLGGVEASALGTVLVHEHVFNSSPGIWSAWPELVGGQEDFLNRAEEALVEVRDEGGVHTIVDLTPRDLGRDIGLLMTMAERSGLNLVASSGLYGLPDMTHHRRSVEELAELFQREVEVGIDGTTARAGVIKCAVEPSGVTPFHERIWRAAGRAHCSTGVPISLHSCASERLGRAQLDVLEAEGVDLGRVCVGHCDDVDNYDDDDEAYIIELAKRGSWIGFDRFPGGPGGAHFQRNWEQRVDFLVRIINAGYGDRVLLSHDFSMGITLLDTDFAKRYADNYPDRWLFIHRNVLPRLAKSGVPQEFVSTVLSRNAQAFLTPATAA